jgi:hypothetical protein
VSFVEIEEFLRELSYGRTDGQTDRQTEFKNTFQLSLKSVRKHSFQIMLVENYVVMVARKICLPVSVAAVGCILGT